MFLWPRGVIQYTYALPAPHTRRHCIEKPFRNTFGENSDTDVLLTWHKHTDKLFFSQDSPFSRGNYSLVKDNIFISLLIY